MKRKFSILFFLIAFVALVVMPTGESVQAYEKQQIETLECDLADIIDINAEITQTVHPIMIVEVEISYGDNLQGFYNLEGSKDNTTTYYSCYALNNSDPLKEAKTCTKMFYDDYRYEQANKLLEYNEFSWYCTNNYYVISHMANRDFTETSYNLKTVNQIESEEVIGFMPYCNSNFYIFT